MDIYAESGTKVRVSPKRAGYEHDKETCRKYLKADETYTVEYTDVHSGHTNVFLREFPGVYFNSVNLDEVAEDCQ